MFNSQYESKFSLTKLLLISHQLSVAQLKSLGVTRPLCFFLPDNMY